MKSLEESKETITQSYVCYEATSTNLQQAWQELHDASTYPDADGERYQRLEQTVLQAKVLAEHAETKFRDSRMEYFRLLRKQRLAGK